MKRRNADCGRLKRPIKRNKITENIYGSAFMYAKFLMLWGLVLFLDFILEFRVEYIWPLWLLFRSLYDSYRYQGLAFSVFFIFIAITSDMICLLFIPVHWLFFAASTYVWVQFVWHTDRGICLPTVSLWLLFVYVEAVVRLRELRTTTPFHLDLCRPFAAHCIGYPVVTLGFGFKSYVGYKMRLRKQREVEKENEFYMQLLHQALPQEQQQNTAEKTKAILSKSEEKDCSQTNSNVKPKGSPSPKSVEVENAKDRDKDSSKQPTSTNNVNLKTGEPEEIKLTQRIVNSYEGTTENLVNEQTLAKNNKHSTSNGVGRQRSGTASREHTKDTQGSSKKGKQYSSKVENKEKEKEMNVTSDMQISNGTATSVSKDEKSARYEMDIKRLKAELQGSRQNEVELKAVVKSLTAQEEVIMSEIDQIKKDNEQLQTKLHNLVTQKQQDKLTLGKLEQKWKAEMASRTAVENQLKEERKSKRAEEAAASRAIAMAAANAARMSECNGSCKIRQSELEKELKMFKDELKGKCDSVRALEKEAEGLRQKPEQQQKTEILMSALAAIQDKNTQLENSLSAETRVKLDLFSALGEARRQLEIAQAQLSKKDQDIHELKTKIAEVMAVMPQSSYPCTTTPITPTKPHYSVAFRQQLDETPKQATNSQRSSLDPNAAVYRPKSN
ncbi:macoilin-like isoform X2 [Anneissia japonica]|uniref:macoilin-like isoform X1 n=1 Tax=Anneissia japonica TaxID=1529436 RepID=UPI001425B46A|nr:macoilin-like isoform X1 [Anneissia japonica]XP_033100439.1 macoilin-like isoform X2 [Anneissia japonica]